MDHRIDMIDILKIGRRARVMALCLAVVACGALATSGDGDESVRPGINKNYLSEDLDVQTWVERFSSESREVYTLRSEIVEQLAIAPGAAIADIGAGTGIFLEPFATAVGDEGKLYAVDISPNFLAYLRERVKKERLSQVQVVTGLEDSVELPEASVDAAFICDTYHHFEYPQRSLASLMTAIRPGGALIIIDFHRIPGESSEFILGHVRAGQEVFVAEIQEAGFVLEKEIEVPGMVENYIGWSDSQDVC